MKSDESKIAMFMSGLRREIQDVVKLYEYSSLEKLVHIAIKVESQLSKKNSFKMLTMMDSTKHLERTKNFKMKNLFQISQENPPHIIGTLSIYLLLLLLSRLPKPKILSILNV